jgi:hypothetical protein
MLILLSAIAYLFTLIFLLPLYFAFKVFRVRCFSAFAVGGGVTVWLLAAFMFLALLGVETALRDEYTIQHLDELSDEAVAKSYWFLPIGALSGAVFWAVLFLKTSTKRDS